MHQMNFVLSYLEILSEFIIHDLVLLNSNQLQFNCLDKENFLLKIWHHELLQLSYRYIVLVAWKGNTISTMLSKFSHCTMLSNKRTSITLISMHITGGLLSHLFASLCLYLVMNI